MGTGPGTSAPSALDRVWEEGRRLERSGNAAEARRLYEASLRDGTVTDAAAAAHLLRLVAATYLHDPDYAAAHDCATCAAVVAEQAGALDELGYATNILAVIEWQQGHLDEARRLYLAARGLAHRVGNGRLAAMVALNLGVIANVRGDEAAARHAYESALSDARGAGLADEAIAALGNLGRLETQAERFEMADRHLVEAREVAVVIGDRNMLVRVELLIARLRIQRGDRAGARSACDRTRALLNELGDGGDRAEAEFVFGLVARATDENDAAEQYFRRAEGFAVERSDLLLQGEVARELADLYRTQGRNRLTLVRLNQAHRLFEQLRARRELADVDRRTAALENDFLDVVRKWGESIESKDHHTQGHCVRVADLACAIWERVGGDDTSRFWFRIGALLHDVGKLMIPAELLNKPGKLTDEEWVMMRGHPTAGVTLLADIEFPWDVRPLVESHHERWDGRGYPHGLAGDAIPLTARVLCIADVYDALTSQRSYKRAFTHDEAMAIMRADNGSQFDPALFAEFERVVAGIGRTRGHLSLVS